MEKFQEMRDTAQKKLKLADHVLTMTYPLVQDTKLLLVVVENLFLSLTNAMGSVLYYERLFKRVPSFTDNFESKFQVFTERCANRYKLNPSYLKLIREIKDIVVEHKKSSIEFVRKDRYIICSDDYRMKAITIDQIKRYIQEAKSFISETSNIVSKNEEIFK